MNGNQIFSPQKQTPNRQRWKTILLICSLLFNLILAGFILYHLVTRPLARPVPPYYEVNREPFREKQQEIREKRAEFLNRKHSFMEKLASSDFDEIELRKQLDQLLEKQMEMEKAIADNFIEMRKRMNDKQADRFFRELPDRMRERRNMLQRRR